MKKHVPVWCPQAPQLVKHLTLGKLHKPELYVYKCASYFSSDHFHFTLSPLYFLTLCKYYIIWLHIKNSYFVFTKFKTSLFSPTFTMQYPNDHEVENQYQPTMYVHFYYIAFYDVHVIRVIYHMHSR